MTYYQLEKTGPVIQRPAGMPGPGAYYTCLHSMAEVEAIPFDHALFFTTDHVPGLGGVWLYLCNGTPTLADNWVSYDEALANGAFNHLELKPEGNPIFVDPKQSDGHTETAHVGVVDGQIFMSYHKDRIPPTQATLLATSPDGLNFQRINGDEDSVILRYDPDTSYGNGHTGYFRWTENRFSGVSAKYVGYSLHGGTDAYYSAMWVSDDAMHWERAGVLEPIEGQALDFEDRMIIWHEIDPASVRETPEGDYVVIGCVGNRASGGMKRIVEMYEIYLAADGMTLTRPAERLFAVGEEFDTEELASPTVVFIEDQVHLLYVGASEGGTVNTIMGARGQFVSEPLTPAPTLERWDEHVLKPER